MFNQHDGTVALKEAWFRLEYDALVEGEAIIDLNRIDCRDIQDASSRKVLIDYLKSSDFFLVNKFPEARFKMVSAERISGAQLGEANYEVNGSLTMRGHTDELLFEAMLGHQGDDIGLQARFDVDRVAFGSRYGSGKIFELIGKHLVNDAFSISFQLIAPKSSVEEASALQA